MDSQKYIFQGYLFLQSRIYQRMFVKDNYSCKCRLKKIRNKRKKIAGTLMCILPKSFSGTLNYARGFFKEYLKKCSYISIIVTYVIC